MSRDAFDAGAQDAVRTALAKAAGEERRRKRRTSNW
jgi:hypothetical protein